MAILGTCVTGAGGGAAGYSVGNSLRFRSSASAYLNRTPSVTSNRRTFTFSCWVKIGTLFTFKNIFQATAGGNGDGLRIKDDNSLDFFLNDGTDGLLVTTQLFRDPSAWYHIVAAVDTTQATSSNRIKLYVNGSQITAFSTANYPSQNYDTNFNLSSNPQYIGRYGGASIQFLDGYLAEVNFINGQQLTPSSFGETNASTGVWQPKAYAGSYSTNGYYLKFSSIATTSGSNTGLGQDFSGNGNFWNTNNISVTAGVTYDAMLDSPTPVSDTVGNYCVLNPILQNGWWAAPSRGSISYANLRLSQNNGTAFSTFDVNTSGKWYCELTITSYGQGAASSEIIVSARSRSTFEVAYYRNGNKSVNDSVSSYGATWTTGDVIGIAIDKTNNQVTFYKNNVSQGTITNTFPNETVLVGYYAEATGTDTIDFNFGQRPFAYTPPTGFKRLQTFNLPTPTIGATASTLAEKYMDISLYSGTSASGNNITDGLSLSSGGLFWVKNRNSTGNHALIDSVRGITKRLISDATNAEDTVSAITSFNANGFTLQGSDGSFNSSGRTYVAWQWLANGSGVSNTAGTITSTVSANTTSGFSVVTYTGNGTNATVGHGLGASPAFIIVKKRSASDPWPTYHASLGVQFYTLLDAADTSYNNLSNYWSATSPSSTVFGLGPGYGGNNSNGATYVAYCFSEVAGYSKFSSYTGNGSNDGTFVYTGFRPRFVLLKRTNAVANWILYDTARATYNVVNNILLPDSDSAELTSTDYNVDIVSNGFKFRTTQGGINGSSDNIIYMAFAESPFNYSLAR